MTRSAAAAIAPWDARCPSIRAHPLPRTATGWRHKRAPLPGAAARCSVAHVVSSPKSFLKPLVERQASVRQLTCCRSVIYTLKTVPWFRSFTSMHSTDRTMQPNMKLRRMTMPRIPSDSKRSCALWRAIMTFCTAQGRSANHIRESNGMLVAVIRRICFVGGLDWTLKCVEVKLHHGIALVCSVHWLETPVSFLHTRVQQVPQEPRVAMSRIEMRVLSSCYCCRVVGGV